jgi:hypothetical protein
VSFVRTRGSLFFQIIFHVFVPALCSILFRGRLVSVLAEVSQLLLVTFVVVTLALVRSALYFFFVVVTLALVRSALNFFSFLLFFSIYFSFLVFSRSLLCMAPCIMIAI